MRMLNVITKRRRTRRTVRVTTELVLTTFVLPINIFLTTIAMPYGILNAYYRTVKRSRVNIRLVADGKRRVSFRANFTVD